MGFGLSGAAAVLGLASLIAASLFTNAMLGAAEDLDEARRAAWSRESSALHTTIDITEVKIISTKLFVIADNTGSTTLNPEDLDVLLAGVHKTDRILNWTADGKAAGSVWPPSTRLYLRLDEGSVPSRAALIVENGIADYWG